MVNSSKFTSRCFIPEKGRLLNRVLNRRLVGPQSCVEVCEEERDILSLLRFEPRIDHPVVYSLYQLSYPTSLGGKRVRESSTLWNLIICCLQKTTTCVYFKISIIILVTCILICSSPSYICHAVGPLVDPFRSHVSRSLFKGLPWFPLPDGQ